MDGGGSKVVTTCENILSILDDVNGKNLKPLKNGRIKRISRTVS